MSWWLPSRHKNVVVVTITTNAAGGAYPGRRIWPRSHSSPGPPATRFLIAVCVLAAVAVVTASPPQPAAAVAPARAPVFGVTVDTIGHLGSTVSALAALPEKPTTRIYFNVREPARYYAAAVRRIGRVSAVMGELLDSSDEKAISVAGFGARVESYLHTLGRQVSIWEIGNEVNGNWTGPYPTVAANLTEAYDGVAAAGGTTALTLYANEFGPDHCGDGPAELTPAQFGRRYVPARVAHGLGYVFLSYYPTQCGNREPSTAELDRALRQLHSIFPAAALGFGEVGLPNPAAKSSLAKARQIMRWAYSLSPQLPYYAGGYFWWYAAEDALHSGAPLRTALRAAFRSEAAALGTGG
jgi:hypothetical protein